MNFKNLKNVILCFLFLFASMAYGDFESHSNSRKPVGSPKTYKHEFSSMRGIVEDQPQVILNIKSVIPKDFSRRSRSY